MRLPLQGEQQVEGKGVRAASWGCGKGAYELQLSEKDTIIAKKEAKISKLEERVAYLERQLYGRKAEKFIKPDAQDRWLDFEGFDMLPEEAEAAAEAEKELQATREAVIARKKMAGKRPVRNPLPEIWNAGRSMFILKGIMKRNGFFFPERK